MADIRVNYKTQIASQLKQKSFYNNAIGFKMDTKALAEFTVKVMLDKDFTERDVAKNSGGGITHAHVNKIKNQLVKDPGVGTLQSLARGLRESEELLFAIARGKPLNGEQIANERFARIAEGYANLSEEEKEKLELTLKILEMTILETEKKTAAPPVAPKSGGKISLEEARRDNDRKNGRLDEKPK